ncbi:MAG: alpha/beta hydrolase [Myxococcota bacterium]
MAWLVGLWFVVAGAFAGSSKAPAPAAVWPAAIALSASDGKPVPAVWGAPAKSDRGVVLVHQSGGAKEDWLAFGDKLFRGGLLVVAVDLRNKGVAADNAAALPMIEDVKAGIAHLRAKGATRIAVVGAELGANIALNLAADDPGVASVALLSPGMDYKGIITPDAIKRYGARPALFVASKDDAYGARSAQALDGQAQGPHQLVIFEAAGKGTKMFNREPSLEGTLLGFVQSGWVAPAAAPPKAAAPAVKVDAATGLETSGPTEFPSETPAPAP